LTSGKSRNKFIGFSQMEMLIHVCILFSENPRADHYQGRCLEEQ